MCRNPLIIFDLFVALHPTPEVIAGSDNPHLFPNVGPSEVECRVGRQRDLLPDGAYGLHYVPDGPISIPGARPLRFLMPVANGTVLVAGKDFGNVVLKCPVMKSSRKGSDANYAGNYSVWEGKPKERTFAVYHAENLARRPAAGST